MNVHQILVFMAHVMMALMDTSAYVMMDIKEIIAISVSEFDNFSFGC